MRPSRRVLFTIVLLAVAAAIGAVAQRDVRFPLPRSESASGASVLSDDAWPIGFGDTTGRTKLDCASVLGANTAVLLILGQSNAGNYGDAAYRSARAVFNFNPADGYCYAADEPLLGATGRKSSPWTRLGDRLIAASLYDKVVLIPIAIGGSSVVDWAWGAGRTRMVSAVYRALAAGLSITQVLWHQGETDALNGMSGETYARHLAVVIRSLRALNVTAPVYVARASLCMDSPRNDDIRAGQRAVTGRLEGVAAGPDTDTLTGQVMRYDGCHFTARGLDAHAQLWFEALAKTAGN